MAQLFAVDVGGTFTDIVVLDGETKDVRFAKVPTTPDQPADGVVNAIERAHLSVPDARVFFHGTTLGINTLHEHKGARTGLIMTRGFRDVLEIGRMNWPPYQLHWEQPESLVPRHLRKEVAERVRADGEVLTPLDEDGLLEAAGELLDEDVESIAVCFLHSYAHPEHEIRAGDLLNEAFDDVSVTLSHEVTQEYREYERTATTVSDAAIKKRMVSYVDVLQESLGERDFNGSFVLTRCDGGAMSADEAKKQPIRTLISGPASGVMGAAALGRDLDLPDLIGIDMGGTSFEAALITDHEPSRSPVTRLEDLPLLVPVVEMATIGSGGGSIAWIDAGGALNVGPQSAGAEPGPICYGRGGTAPTFTDAALVSGLLDADNFLGGEIALDVKAARRGIEQEIAGPLDLDVDEAASGIVALTEAKMSGTLEEITVGKGYDPRDFSLLAYGGGGALVAGALADRLEIPRVIIPQSPATFSAWGMLTLDIVHDFARTAISKLSKLDRADVRARFSELEEEAADALDREAVEAERRLLQRSLDMRYEGQEHTLTLGLGSNLLADLSIEELRETFDERHESTYGYAMDDPVEVTAYRIRAVGLMDSPRLPTLEPGGESSEHALTGTRRAEHRESGGEMDWDIYDRGRLQAGNRLSGPAIVQEPTATTLVSPGQELQVDEYGNLIITRG